MRRFHSLIETRKSTHAHRKSVQILISTPELGFYRKNHTKFHAFLFVAFFCGGENFLLCFYEEKKLTLRAQGALGLSL